MDSQQNLVETAELYAKDVIYQVGHPKNFETKQQIISRIESIQRGIRGFDLVIESETFRELARISGVKLPRLHDRIVQGYTQILTLQNKKEKVLDDLQAIFEFIFSWDSELKRHVTSDFSEFARYAIENRVNHDKIKHIIEIQEIYEAISSKNIAPHSTLIPFLIYVFKKIRLTSLVLLSFIPNSIRALARKSGIPEESALRMHSQDLTKVAYTSKTGEHILELTKMLIEKDIKKLESTHSGKFMLHELVSHNFWDENNFIAGKSILRGLIH